VDPFGFDKIFTTPSCASPFPDKAVDFPFARPGFFWVMPGEGLLGLSRNLPEVRMDHSGARIPKWVHFLVPSPDQRSG